MGKYEFCEEYNLTDNIEQNFFLFFWRISSTISYKAWKLSTGNKFSPLKIFFWYCSIYLCMAALGLCSWMQAFSSCGAQASYCGGFSCGAQALGMGFSGCDPGLISGNLRTLEHAGFSSRDLSSCGWEHRQ